jgi:hypothetical protein
LPSDPAYTSGVDEHFGPIGDANLDKIDAAVAALGSGSGPSAPVGSHTIYVDGSRTDQYTPNGSINQPLLTIQKAINQITANGDCSVAAPYVINVAPGTYPENLDFSCPGTASVNIFVTADVASGATSSTPIYLGTAAQTSITMAANANRITFMGFHINGNVVGNGSVNLVFDSCYMGNGTSVVFNGAGSLCYYDCQIWTSSISLLAGLCLTVHSDFKTPITWSLASGSSLSLYAGSTFIGPITVPNGVTFSMGSGSRTYDSTSNITVASGGTFRALNIASLGSLTVQAGGTALVVDSSFTSVSNSGTITATETNVSGGVTLCAAAPTVGAGQIGLGGTTDTAASAGAGTAPPATVDGYLVINVNGTTKKIPYYAL